MSQNGSVGDLAASVAALPVEKRKKRPARAFHPTFTYPQAPFAAGAKTPGQNGLGTPLMTPTTPQGAFFAGADSHVLSRGSQMSSPNQIGFLSPAPAIPATPVAFSQSSFFRSPGVADMSGQAEAGGADAAAELSLCASRNQSQDEYSTPLYGPNGEPEGYKVFLLFQNIVPPVAGTQYIAVDEGTATPKHMRATMYNVPESEQLRRATKLPMAVTVRPFAPISPNEEPVPVVDMSHLGTSGQFGGSADDEIGPPRCNRCRTYMNPSMMHTSGGRFTCNVCRFPNNSVPSEYVSMVDPVTNQRADRNMRPELHRGVYDIVVPSYYNVGGAEKTPQSLHHVFLVDVLHQSIVKQLPVLVADAIRAAMLDYDQSNSAESSLGQEKIPRRFALMLFDKRMHWYNLSPELETCQESVMGDLDDPFIPFHTGLFADPEASRAVVEDALAQLEQLCTDDVLHDTEPCFSVAVRTAAMCLEAVGGGKITAVLSTLPSWGPGASKLKENRAVGRALAESEQRMLAADNAYYQKLAADLVAQNVGVDVFAVATTSVDVCNLGWMASVTGGNMYKYPSFNFERDGCRLTDAIVQSVHKCAGYQGQLKVRCSNGLQVAQYYGFPAHSDAMGLGSADPVIPVLSADQAFTVLMEYDGTLDTKYDCHVQAALLYTDPQGVRKVRVINLVLAVSERLQDVFSFVDQDAVVCAVVRDTLSFVGKELMAELRRSVNAKLVDVFALYRAVAEESHNRTAMTNQLIFPDLLKHLPAYFLALLKTKALRDSTAVLADSRLCDAFQMLNMPLERLVYHLYPAVVELHLLEDDDCMPLDSGFIKVPRYVPASHDALQYGVYILCNGSTVYVRVHPDTNQNLLRDLFGDHVHTVNDIDPLLDSLPELPTHISQQARNLVRFFNTHIVGSGTIATSAIQVVRDGIDSITYEFRECLIEDHLPSKTVNTTPSYAEFLQLLHGAVKAKVESERKNVRQAAVHLHDTLAQRMIHF